MEIKCTDYLTWQFLGSKDQQQFLKAPRPVNSSLPDWWRNLPGDLSAVTEKDAGHRGILSDHGNRSARFCLGLRGAHNLGWTIPLQNQLVFFYPDHDDSTIGTVSRQQWSWSIFYKNVRDPTWPDCDQEQDFDALPDSIQQELIKVHGYDPGAMRQSWHNFVQRQRLHPGMLQGSIWGKQHNGQYDWGVEILSWPWRAKMSKGWRLLVMAHPLEWSHDWRVFTGCTQPRYNDDGFSIGTFWQSADPIKDEFDYFNLEIVLAYRYPRTVIAGGTCLFSAVPIWDPDYRAPAFRSHPSFASCPNH